MGTETAIAWTHHTFNPWIGCAKVAPECANCYAEAYANRYGSAVWGVNGTRRLTSPANWNQPHKWNREALAAGERRRVFCASLADVFEDWPGPFVLPGREPVYVGANLRASRGPTDRATIETVRRHLFDLIDKTPALDWLLLTKRPENICRFWPSPMPCGGTRWGFDHYRKNVWLGTSAGTQAKADEKIPELLKCRDLAPVLFVSAEPLLETVDYFPGVFDANGFATSKPRGIDWLIVGGESGDGRRDCGVAAIADAARQAQAAGVPTFVKQDCARHAGEQGRIPDDVFALKEFPTASFLES